MRRAPVQAMVQEHQLRAPLLVSANLRTQPLPQPWHRRAGRCAPQRLSA